MKPLIICLTVALITFITGTVPRAQEKTSDIPLDNPFTTFSGPPVSETKISGAIVTTINNGDFVHPTFSPDGKVLAYSNVLSDRGDNPLFVFEGTQLLRIKEHSELYDAAVDPTGRRIAYCYWAGDKRHIVVALHE